jgi:dolichyl-phosphate beta-glucosyltransferase
MTAPSVSFVIPVYNEELVLARTFATLVPFVEALGESFEIVCADDGSEDGSARILAEAAKKDPRIRVLTLPENRGKGSAVRAGVLETRGERVIFLDADLSTPLEECSGFLGALGSGYDVVLGDRRAPGSRITRRQPWIRETLGKGFTVLTQALLAPGVRDFTCGFKGFQREAAQAIFSRSRIDGWAFDVEIVVIAKLHGFKVVQVPVGWRHEDDSKVRVLGAVLRSLSELGRIWLNRRRGLYD